MAVDAPSRGLLAPALLCGLAATTLAVQLVAPSSTSATPGSPAAHAAAALPAAAVPDAPIAPAAETAPLGLRPLFSPARAAGAGPAAAAGAFTLLGVASAAGRASAVLRAADGLHTLRLGETLEGWRLVAIDGDRAALRRDGRVQDLRIGASAATARWADVAAVVGAARPPRRSSRWR